MTNSTLPQAHSSGLVARGLLAIQRSLAIADKDDAESLFQEGMRFRNGEDGTPRDDAKARRHLLAAARLNHAEAQFELCVFLGEYDEWCEAVAWLEKSVSLAFGPAQKYLVECLSDPFPSITDHLSNSYDADQLYDQASAWYDQRATAGDAGAQYDFALMFRNPKAPNFSPEKALQWMEAAAKQDHGSACMCLGEWLLDDKDPHQNTEQGIYWLSSAAKLGKSHACKRLGDLYLFGHMGSRYASRSFSQIVVPDKRVAVAWYGRQIELERQRGSLMGEDSLGRLYLFGDHVDQNLALAEQMLLHAATAGYLYSQRLLASEYTSGRRLKRDTATALHWLKAAEQNTDSEKRIDQYQLGHFYEYEADDAPNYFEAIMWYRKAADQGDYRSQKSLGDIYECGKGAPKDYVQAYKWYLLAAANSYGKAGIRDFHTGTLRSRDFLADKMTATERAEAGKLAREWMDKIKSLRSTFHELAREGLEDAS